MPKQTGLLRVDPSIKFYTENQYVRGVKWKTLVFCRVQTEMPWSIRRPLECNLSITLSHFRSRFYSNFFAAVTWAYLASNVRDTWHCTVNNPQKPNPEVVGSSRCWHSWTISGGWTFSASANRPCAYWISFLKQTTDFTRKNADNRHWDSFATRASRLGSWENCPRHPSVHSRHLVSFVRPYQLYSN